MATKQLKSKAIKIKGKDYVLVSDRINYFNDTYPKGCIKTTLLSPPDADRVVVMAEVIPNIETPDRKFLGHSQALWGDGYINKTSALENAETSAVGRALGMMGIGVIDSVASIDEIKKAEQQEDVIDRSAIHDHIDESNSDVGGLTATCPIHNAVMTEKVSSKTNRPYFSHVINGKHCFGK